jgi:hypothetical protein
LIITVPGALTFWTAIKLIAGSVIGVCFILAAVRKPR